MEPVDGMSCTQMSDSEIVLVGGYREKAVYKFDFKQEAIEKITETTVNR
jgi:hypothetical protein